MVLPPDFWDEIRERFESRMARITVVAEQAEQRGSFWSEQPLQELRETTQITRNEYSLAVRGFRQCVRDLPELERLAAEVAFRTAVYDVIAGHWEYTRRLLQRIRKERNPT